MSKTLTFSRSDGDASRWPAGWLDHEVDINSNQNYHEKVKEGHSKYELFLSKIGQSLAENRDLPNPSSYRLSDFPDGYALFLHHKQQKDGSDRTDIYMFGSKHVLKFRSPAEMYLHAEWLMNENLDIENHKTCTCKYSNNYTAPVIDPAERKRKPTKDDSGPSTTKPSDAKKQKQGPKTLEQRHADYKADMLSCARERKGELRSRAIGRRGDVVWCRLPTVQAPAHATTATRSVIYWPGVINIIQTKPTTPPADENGNYTSHHSYVYDIKLAGQLDPDLSPPTENASPLKHVKLDEVDVLPWQLFDADAIMTSVIKDAADIANRYIQATPLVEDEEMIVDAEEQEREKPPSWQVTLARRFKLSEMAAPENWEMVLVNYAWALRFAGDVSRSWSQTNAYANSEQIKDPTVHTTQAERDELAGKTRIFFQGLHWAGERIWMDDLVRLTKRRDILPGAAGSADVEGPLAAASPGAVDHGVFMQVKVIAVDELATHPAPADRAYSCRIQGDIYEFAEVEWDRENPLPNVKSALQVANGVKEDVVMTLADAAGAAATATAGAGPLSFDGTPKEAMKQEANEDEEDQLAEAVGLPKPPKGFVFRRLNKVDDEVTCDVFDISGRYYNPGLLTHPLVASPPASSPPIPPDSLKRLTGLLPSTTTMKSETSRWRANKYVSLLHAHESSSQWLAEFFVDTRDGDAKVASASVVPVADKMELTAAWVRTA